MPKLRNLTQVERDERKRAIKERRTNKGVKGYSPPKVLQQRYLHNSAPRKLPIDYRFLEDGKTVNPEYNRNTSRCVRSGENP
jgi:hypothetical protein